MTCHPTLTFVCLTCTPLSQRLSRPSQIMLVTILWSHDTVILLFIRVGYSHATIFGIQHRQTDGQTDVSGQRKLRDAIRFLRHFVTYLPKYTASHPRRPQNMWRSFESPLRAGRYGDRIPVETRFSAPIQTGHRAHPASRTVGTGSFPGVRRPGRGVDHPSSSSAEVKERAIPLLPLGPSWPLLG